MSEFEQEDDIDVIDQEGEEPEVDPDAGEEAPEEDFVVDLDPEPEAQPHGEAVRNLRARLKELEAEKKALEAKVQPQQELEELGAKPKLADFDFDDDKFEAAILEWNERKRKIEAKASEREELQRKQDEAWKARLSFYEESKSKLGVADYDDAEATLSEVLSPGFPGLTAPDIRMNIIKGGAKDPSLLIYALAKRPEKAKALAEIEDPVQFAWEASRIEATMKVNRKQPPTPERMPSGKKGGATIDAAYDRALEKALKTGDATELRKIRQMKRANA